MEKDGNKFIISAEDEIELTNWRTLIEAKVLENDQKKKNIIDQITLDFDKPEEVDIYFLVNLRRKLILTLLTCRYNLKLVN